MVECTGSKTAEMARRLEAVHRWAITGTPVQKSMHGESVLALSVFTVFFKSCFFCNIFVHCIVHRIPVKS
jgi:hypothetical protein